MIRPATENDLRRIVEMSEKFYATTSYAKFAQFHPSSVAVLATTLIHYGVMLVAEVEGKVIGMVGLVVTPFMFNTTILSAHEVVWWVEPEYQGSKIGHSLLTAIEPACKSRGCKLIQMVTLSNSPPQAAGLYEKAGYKHTETSYTKVI